MINRIINSSIFAILIGLLIFVAQDGGQYSDEIKVVLQSILFLILVYLFFLFARLVRTSLVSRKYDVIADIADHQLVISSSNIDAKLYYTLTNKSKSVVRTINYDYDGGYIPGTIFPKYIVHYRSKLLTADISTVGGENGFLLNSTHEYGNNRQIYYAEWGVDLHEPLQPNESVSYSRHYDKPINEKIYIDAMNEFSFRMRLPTKRFLLSIYCEDLYLHSQEVYKTDQSGKKIKNISFEGRPFSIKIEIERLEPNERIAIRFIPKHV